MKKMKKVVLDSSPAYVFDEEAKNKFKHQSLMQDFSELEKVRSGSCFVFLSLYFGRFRTFFCLGSLLWIWVLFFFPFVQDLVFFLRWVHHFFLLWGRSRVLWCGVFFRRSRVCNFMTFLHLAWFKKGSWLPVLLVLKFKFRLLLYVNSSPCYICWFVSCQWSGVFLGFLLLNGENRASVVFSIIIFWGVFLACWFVKHMGFFGFILLLICNFSESSLLWFAEELGLRGLILGLSKISFGPFLYWIKYPSLTNYNLLMGFFLMGFSVIIWNMPMPFKISYDHF